MEGLLILGLLVAGIAGAPEPAPPAALVPVAMPVQLVSVRFTPAAGSWTGRGYLWLEAVVPDSPTLPVEQLAPGTRTVLPGVGLHPEPFRVPGDGRWHTPSVVGPWLGQEGTWSGASGHLVVYPDESGARIRVALWWEGAWTWAENASWLVPRPGAQRTFTFRVPGGVVEAYVAAGPW